MRTILYIVSKLGVQLAPYESLIQTDAAINPGNSGGALVDQFGNVIGINTLGIKSAEVSNINFAISIDQALPVVTTLKQGHNKLWVGMNLVANTFAKYFGTDTGVVVAAVDSGSPAEKAGVQPAYLLEQVEGSDVNSVGDVCKILRSHNDGDQLKLGFLNVTKTQQQILEGDVGIGDPKNVTAVKLVQSKAIGTSASANGSSGTSGGSSNMVSKNYTFGADDGDWFTGSSSDGSETAQISNGAYAVTIKKPDIFDLYTAKSMPTGTDQAIGTDLLVRSGSGGVALRWSSTSDKKWTFYYCWINAGNGYGCSVSVQDNITTLVQSGTSSAIKPGQANRLVLVMEGNKLTFSVNGTTLATANDGQVGRGVPALFVTGTKTAGAQSLFANVQVQVVPSGS